MATTAIPCSEADAEDILRQAHALATIGGLYSDLTIECKGTEFKVHKIILHVQSPAFAKMLGGDFKECQPGVHNISLPDDDPESFRGLLDWFYTRVHKAPPDVGALEYLVKIALLADKYQMMALFEEAHRQFSEKCHNEVNLDDVTAALHLLHEADSDSAACRRFQGSAVSCLIEMTKRKMLRCYEPLGRMLKEMMEWEDEMSDMVCNEVEKLRDKFPALYIARREQLLLWATISRMKWTLRRQIQPISKMETDALVWS